jgi:hypothetical protein
MSKIFLLYSTDSWHTKDSKFLHGAFGSKDSAIEGIREMIERHGNPEKYPPLGEECERQLELFNQTQSYAGEGEFQIDEIPVDEIDCWL